MAEIEKTSPASAGLVAIAADGTVVALWDTPFMALAQRGTSDS
jgi:hypothetical protein